MSIFLKFGVGVGGHGGGCSVAVVDAATFRCATGYGAAIVEGSSYGSLHHRRCR